MANKFCPQCGAQVITEAQFCPTCGFQMGLKNADPVPNGSVADTIGIPVAGAPAVPAAGEKKSVKYAEFGDRFIAFIIDSIIVSAITSIFFRGGDDGNFWGFGGISSVILFVYLLLMEMSSNGRGQTLGKMVMKIKTVDEVTHGSITPQQALLHVIGKAFFLPIDVILGLITRDSDKKDLTKQDNHQIRISQRFSHTVVIKTV